MVATTDPIADMLTRIRNAFLVGHESVVIPYSNIKKEVGRVLKEEGYISDLEVFWDDDKHKNIKVQLKYFNSKPVITGIKRISKPSLRNYTNKKRIPRVLGGLGIAILSTSKGIMTDKYARIHGVGGEILCYVW